MNKAIPNSVIQAPKIGKLKFTIIPAPIPIIELFINIHFFIVFKCDSPLWLGTEGCARKGESRLLLRFKPPHSR